MALPASVNPQGLKILISSYLPQADLGLVDKAWEIVSKVHSETRHSSGEMYVIHLLEVASTLASMKLDMDTILAGLLHGVLNEGVKYQELVDKFGPDVAGIVQGSTKITAVAYNSKLADKAENLRKMLLAIAADIRVLLVKLVDRLQDMFLLDMADRERQLDLARETMDVYAPLASRLGIDWLKRELEDQAFKFLYPDEYYDLNSTLEDSLEERQTYVDDVIKILHQKLAESDIKPTRVIGRPKHLYSIYKKLVAQNIPLERVYDKVAFRIIVTTVKECYAALGTIHSNWPPVQGRIKDFISSPKANNYQSMHTTVVGPGEQFIEIQIRTEEMDRVAQEGVAAHWAYKEGSHKASSSDARLFRELKKLVASLQEVEDPREFLDSLIGELYEPEVYAVTPTGEVKEFPLGSCPIDFAYSIHTEVGDQCVGARVGGKQVSLKYQIQNGDIIEILTSPTQQPRRDWLDLVKTSRARTRIRSWFRREERENALKLGREICDREIRKYNTSLKKIIKSGHIRLLLKQLRCNALDDLLAKVGSGTITIANLIKALQPVELRKESELGTGQLDPEELARLMQSSPQQVDGKNKAGINIDGIEGMLVKISQCCSPLPGDPIVGYITMGQGVSIHKSSCSNLLISDPLRWIEVSWSGIAEKSYTVTIHVSAESKKGLLADISTAISSDNANIVDISAHTRPMDIADITLALEVENLQHLNLLMMHLKQLPSVISVRRL